jgi:hypothetical protein
MRGPLSLNDLKIHKGMAHFHAAAATMTLSMKRCERNMSFCNVTFSKAIIHYIN